LNKKQESILPKKLLWRLALTNVIIIALFVGLSGWAIYQTACFLVGDLSLLHRSAPGSFNVQLFRYLIIFSIIAIVLGSLIHIYVTKALIRPLQKLIDSTVTMKSGTYPAPIASQSTDEIGQLTNHFNELVAEIKANETERDKLLADLSHELRTPLANLNGYLSALKDGVIEGDKQLYESLHSELQRITEMMDQLDRLKEWGMLADRYLIDKESVAIDQLLAQNIQMFQLTMEENNIPLQTNFEHAFLQINAEGINQVISNVLENAIQYYEGTDPIVVQGSLADNHYEIDVIGEGSPITNEDEQYIFERFYRVDPSRTRTSGGSGLGLAISKEIVEQHEGRITLITDGNVHQFKITLPYDGV